MKLFKKFLPYAIHLTIEIPLFFYGLWLFNYDSAHDLSEFDSITLYLILPSLIYWVIKNLSAFYIFKTNYPKNINYSLISRIFSQVAMLFLALISLLFTAMFSFAAFNLLSIKGFSNLSYLIGALILLIIVYFFDIILLKNKDSVSFIISLLVFALSIILLFYSIVIDVKYSVTLNAIVAIAFLFLDRKNLVRISGKDLVFGKKTTDKFLFIVKITASSFVAFSIFSALIIPNKTVNFNKPVSVFITYLISIGYRRLLITGILVSILLFIVLGVQNFWSKYVEKQNSKLGNKYYRLHKKSRKR